MQNHFRIQFVYEKAQAQLENIYYPPVVPTYAATIQHGRDLIQQAQELGAKTARERIYIDALATFCKGYEQTRQARTDAYVMPCKFSLLVSRKGLPYAARNFGAKQPGGAPVIR